MGNPQGEYDIKQSFGYLNIPLLLRMNFGDQFKYFINAGANFGVLLSEGSSIEKNGLEIPGNESGKENYAPLEIGFLLGVGIAYEITDNLAISCELRNNLGLNNISRIDVAQGSTTKTNATHLLLGLNYIL